MRDQKEFTLYNHGLLHRVPLRAHLAVVSSSVPLLPDHAPEAQRSSLRGRGLLHTFVIAITYPGALLMLMGMGHPCYSFTAWHIFLPEHPLTLPFEQWND